jgi:uncharacterized protein (TIGR02246 family)
MLPNVALKLPNARTAPTARIAQALRVRSLTWVLGRNRVLREGEGMRTFRVVAWLPVLVPPLLAGCAAGGASGRPPFPAPPAVRPPPTAALEAEVLRLNERLSAAVLASDAAAMGEILAPEYVFISASGGAGGTRQSMLSAYAAGALRYEDYRADSVRVRVFGDAAIVTCLIVRRGRSASGGDLSGRFRSTRVYVRREGRWQLVSAQETRVAPQ